MRLGDLDALKETLFIKFGNQLPNGLLDEIDNAPTVEAYPFEQVQELVKLNQQFAQEIENLKRPQGEWIYDNKLCNWKCSVCLETPKTIGYVGNRDFMNEHFKYCNHCGAEMRKPNCVTCDHFGDCDGCEKGEEE